MTRYSMYSGEKLEHRNSTDFDTLVGVTRPVNREYGEQCTAVVVAQQVGILRQLKLATFDSNFRKIDPGS